MLEKLEKEELLDLIYEYNNYVMDFDQENGWPVCVKEFFSIEYQMILEERMGDTSSQGEYASEFATEKSIKPLINKKDIYESQRDHC